MLMVRMRFELCPCMEVIYKWSKELDEFPLYYHDYSMTWSQLFHDMIMPIPWHDHDYSMILSRSLELGRDLEGSRRILKDLGGSCRISRVLHDLEWSFRILKGLAGSWRILKDLGGSCRISWVLQDLEWSFRILKGLVGSWRTAKFLNGSLNCQKCDWVSESVTGPDLERHAPLIK